MVSFTPWKIRCPKHLHKLHETNLLISTAHGYLRSEKWWNPPLLCRHQNPASDSQPNLDEPSGFPCVLMRVETRLELEEENLLFKTSKPATDTGIQNMFCWYVYRFFLCGFLSRSFGAKTKTRDKCVQLRTASFGGEKIPVKKHRNYPMEIVAFGKGVSQKNLGKTASSQWPRRRCALLMARIVVASERLLNSWAVFKSLIPGSQPPF